MIRIFKPIASGLWNAGIALALSLAVGCAHAEGAAKVKTVASGLQFPEGTIFVGNTLYFVDYGTSDVLRLVDGKVQKVWHQDGCGTNGLVKAGDALLVACYDSGTIAEITFEGRLIDTIKSDDKGTPFNSPNDLAGDKNGGVYFTVSGSGATPGKVYYRGADRHVREVASDIRYANGLVISLDGKRLYLAESDADRLLTYEIAPDGTLSDRREFITLANALAVPGEVRFTPDGVRLDRHGNVFVALYRGGGFAVISPQGHLLKWISLPGAHHSNLAISPASSYVFVTAVYDLPGGGSRAEILKLASPILN
jgi:gluconolactonase